MSSLGRRELPGVPPLFLGDPTGARGFEAAVAAAVTARLGVDAADVTWVSRRFDSVLAEGPKDFDIALNRIPIPPERGTAVDFSPSYYDVRQAVVASPANAATQDVDTVADLRMATLGAREGTDALQAIQAVVAPDTEPIGFTSDDAAQAALLAGSIDGLVVDLPTAYYLTTVEMQGTRIIGTLPLVDDEPVQFGLVLESGSPLTPCVAEAVDSLRDDGTLSRLEDTWLFGATAPELPA